MPTKHLKGHSASRVGDFFGPQGILSFSCFQTENLVTHKTRILLFISLTCSDLF